MAGTMKYMSNLFEAGKSYKKFNVISVFDVPDYHSKAVYLRHSKTGLEVIHFQNDDSENLFSFSFRTPNPKANGAAHIIEHSVLCGSEKFPLKDPFVNLSNQSVKTYLNAMTFPDKTVYPASSISSQDYFNLMNVYGDAVFFPKLNKEIFMQEAHRLEVSEDGEVSIQGVVYNEMKGAYSSFDSIANDSIALSLLKDSIYQKDSGGDPVSIPDFSYEEFLAFHKKWYRADNCLVFLYGDIKTETQLDFLQDNFLDRIEKRNCKFEASDESRQKNIEEFLSFVKSSKILEPVYEEYEGPAGDGEDKSTVLVSWNLGNVKNSREATENIVVAGILANHDGSPLQKALMDSGLGEDTAPQSGFSASFFDNIFTIGLRGVQKEDAMKVQDIVFNELERIVKCGVSQRDIDSTLMGMEISQREIKRGHGPFSIALMTKTVSGWVYGYDVTEQIRTRKDLDDLKVRINEDPEFLKRLIEKKFLQNKSRSVTVTTPVKSYNEKRKNLEQELIKKLLSRTNIQEIKAENEKLHSFQQAQDDVSCLPHLKPSDFITDGKPLMNRVEISYEEIDSCNSKQIPLFTNNENTNGIVYFEVGFPVDTLSSLDYPYLQMFANTVTECGWKNKNWAETAEETALHTGGLGACLLTMDGSTTADGIAMRKAHDWVNRDWLIFRMMMIEEESQNAINLLRDCLTGTNFSDLKRIRDIVNESKNDFESSIIPDGHVYASCRVCSSNSQKSAIDEIWNGLTQLSIMRKLAKKSDKEISSLFQRLHSKILDSGAFIHITAEKSGVEKVKKMLPAFIKDCQIKGIQNPSNNSKEDFEKVINQEFDFSDSNGQEIFTVNSQVGYVAQSIPAASYGTKECAADEICSHWLSNNLLWEKIRTVGGAYGAFCTPENFTELIVFATYRDPKPLESSNTFFECLEKCAEMNFTAEEIEKTVMGCYSHFIQPQTPKSRGSTSLTRTLYGITDSDREQKIRWLLEINQQDVKDAFKRLLEGVKNPALSSKMRQAIIADKKYAGGAFEKSKKIGKIVELAL